MPHANDQAHLQATETSSRPSKSTHKHSLLHCLVRTVCNKHQGTHTPRHQHKARKAQLDVCCWQHCTKTNSKTKIIQAIFGLSSEPHAHHARCQKGKAEKLKQANVAWRSFTCETVVGAVGQDPSPQPHNADLEMEYLKDFQPKGPAPDVLECRQPFPGLQPFWASG